MYEGDFFDNFGILDDDRQESKVQHKLIDIIFIVVSAVISGCNEWKEIHMWASHEVNITWLKKYIELSNGIPSLSTIGRLFNVINPNQFEKCFIEWMKIAVNLPQKDIVSIDGKTMRGSLDRVNNKRGVHIVNAICSSHNLVLGQVKTEEKSNEITAIPELLDLLFIEGTIVTIDAMGAQKKITKKIVKDCKADYVINLKDNQEILHDEVKEYFNLLEKEGKLEIKDINESLKGFETKVGCGQLGIYRTIEKGHGRIEKRTYYYSTDTEWMLDTKKEWEKLNGIGMVIREVEFLSKENKKTIETSNYIGSVTSVMDFSRASRNHWAVESMHWSLDVTFKDDANRTRKGMAPQNMAVLKRIAFNAVKSDTVKYPKQSMKGKRFIALMTPEYRDFLLKLNFKER